MAMQAKQLTSKEINIYIKLMKYALESLDVYMIGRKTSSNNSTTTTSNSTSTTNNNNNNKEEKDTIESLGHVFTLLHPLTLKEIFSLTVDYLIERTFKNPNISIISSYFLATPSTSCTYATILIEYLLGKMELMGCMYINFVIFLSSLNAYTSN